MRNAKEALAKARHGARLKVLHLIEDLENGGAERVLINLALGLDSKKFAVTVCCLTRKGRMAVELEEAGIPVHVMHKRPKVDMGLVLRLRALMLELQIDIVHCHVFTANLWGRIAAILARVPVLITHEHSSFTIADQRRRWLEKILIRKTARVITVSEELRQRLLVQGRLPAEKILAIHNGLEFSRRRDERRLAPLRQELGLEIFQHVIGAVGRLEYRKNYPLLLEAFAKVLEQHPRAGLLFVGAGPEAARLRQRAHELALTDHVVFAGYRKDITDVLGVMTVFCSSSQTEGISMAILEAMAGGLPVVATSVGGNPEILPSREYGILVPSGDAPALAQALADTLRDPERARRMAQHGQQRVLEHFSAERMLQRVEEMYLRLSNAVRK